MKKLKWASLFFLTVAILLFSYTSYHKMNINDIGLKIFSIIKTVKGESVDLDSLGVKSTPKINHQLWGSLLIDYVDPSGKVNYKGLINDQQRLNDYLNLLSSNPPGKNWNHSEQLAYWINAYNAFTVKLIIDHYPLKSIKDIADGLPMINSPWDIKFFKIGDIDFDLNTVEHEILRKQFDEPRIHFAINCASFSCPKLRNEAFTATQLEQQLEDQSQYFINNPDKNIINNQETKLSKIFDWFQSDFSKNTNLESFIDSYHPDFNPDNSIQYIEYNWALNE